jgi:GH18 family chitinase
MKNNTKKTINKTTPPITKFIRRKKLGGIMFWNLAQDTKTDGLVDVMHKWLG